jgi:hypothetical protein
VTNQDKKDSIRGRMADTGEPFNVARRKAQAAAGQVPEGEDPYQLIEVEVGSDGDLLDADRRHIETFWGRWILAPDPDKTLTAIPGHGPKDGYYGVAQTRRGRIAVYRGFDRDLPWGNSTTTTYWMMLSCPKTSKARWMPRWAPGKSSTATSDPTA